MDGDLLRLVVIVSFEEVVHCLAFLVARCHLVGHVSAENSDCLLQSALTADERLFPFVKSCIAVASERRSCLI